MNLDLATLQVLILALPGFIWTRFTLSLTGKNSEGVGQEIISALIYGVLTYLVLFALHRIARRTFDMAMFGTPNWSFSASITEILYSIPLSLLLACLLLWVKRKQVHIKFLRRIGVTDFSGDLDIWDYCFSEFKPNGCYVNIRDHENGWIIQGFTRGFLERRDLREVLLDDVEVFDEFGNKLFANSSMYVGRHPEKISIDFYADDGVKNGKKPDHSNKQFLTDGKLVQRGKLIAPSTSVAAGKITSAKPPARPAAPNPSKKPGGASNK